MASDDRKLYDVNKGFGRDGGPYMDEVDRRQAEVNRARVEGREPDLDNPPPIAGSQLVDAKTLVQQYNPASHPSMDSGSALAAAVDLAADDPDHPLTADAAVPAEVVETASSNQQLQNEGASEFKSAGGETIGEYGTVDNSGEQLSEHDTSGTPDSDSGVSGVSDSGAGGSETAVAEDNAVANDSEAFPDVPTLDAPKE